jgi:hypothetical protein
MSEINGVTNRRIAFRMTTGPARLVSSEFELPQQTDVPARSAPADNAPAVVLDTILALQEVDSLPIADRMARRHADSMLGIMAELQAGLLGGADADTNGAMGRLQRLANTMPLAADPRLIGVLRHLRLRAMVELARRDG